MGGSRGTQQCQVSYTRIASIAEPIYTASAPSRKQLPNAAVSLDDIRNLIEYYHCTLCYSASLLCDIADAQKPVLKKGLYIRGIKASWSIIENEGHLFRNDCLP